MIEVNVIEVGRFLLGVVFVAAAMLAVACAAVGLVAIWKTVQADRLISGAYRTPGWLLLCVAAAAGLALATALLWGAGVLMAPTGL